MDESGGYFLRLPRRLRAALSPLRGRPSSAHSKRRGLSCHCSLLGDCTPAPRALWSFRTPGKHRVHISIRLLFHVASLPRHPPPDSGGLFGSREGPWVITVSQLGADVLRLHCNETSVKRLNRRVKCLPAKVQKSARPTKLRWKVFGGAEDKFEPGSWHLYETLITAWFWRGFSIRSSGTLPEIMLHIGCFSRGV